MSDDTRRPIDFGDIRPFMVVQARYNNDPEIIGCDLYMDLEKMVEAMRRDEIDPKSIYTDGEIYCPDGEPWSLFEATYALHLVQGKIVMIYLTYSVDHFALGSFIEQSCETHDILPTAVHTHAPIEDRPELILNELPAPEPFELPPDWPPFEDGVPVVELGEAPPEGHALVFMGEMPGVAGEELRPDMGHRVVREDGKPRVAVLFLSTTDDSRGQVPGDDDPGEDWVKNNT